MNIQSYLENYLTKPEVTELLLKYINERNMEYSELESDQIIDMLDELNLLQPLYEQIQKSELEGNDHDGEIKQNNNERSKIFKSVSMNKNFIGIKIKSGRKFKEFKSSSEEQQQHLQPAKTTTNPTTNHLKFIIEIIGFDQKYSTELISISEEFTIINDMIFSVGVNDLNIENQCPFELLFSIVNTEMGYKKLLSIKLIEWRYLLCYKKTAFEIELAPYKQREREREGDDEAVGILNLELRLEGEILSKSFTSEKMVENQMELEKKLKEKLNDRFYAAASSFWKEYKQTHSSFGERRVKIYAKSEDHIFVPLPKMVTPLYNLRGIESPNHALRFCSLIEFEEREDQSDRRFCSNDGNDCHKRYSSIVAGRTGSVDDHCHLLCGMLLGFGLRAYVAVGYDGRGDEHSWVVSIAGQLGEKKPVSSSNSSSVTFWECTKGGGQRFDYYSEKTFKYYRSIHSLYNHESFYANMQLDDTVISTKFELSDPTQWKAIDKFLIKDIGLGYNRQLALGQGHEWGSSNSSSPFQKEKELENELKSLISKHRRSKSKTSKLPHKEAMYDSALESILTMALTNYELERVTGYSLCEDDFKQSVKDYVPPEHVFKAFPIQITTTLKPELIFEKLLEQKHCMNILNLRGGECMYFGLKTKLVLMPESVFALWVIVAVRYSSISE